jgi:hypothetical protein
MDWTRYFAARSGIVALAEANRRIAVHAVLPDIFDAVVRAAPGMIIELGVSREALANKALVAAANLFGARIASCDLYDFSDVCSYPRWSFFREDARDFGRRYRALADAAGNKPDVDVLFVDTDELYDTTLDIWEAWSPNLAPACTVMFRCTNLQKRLVYDDGTSTMLGWDNQRGVVRVVEEILGVNKMDEERFQVWDFNGWHIFHLPWGAGLTVLRRKAA